LDGLVTVRVIRVDVDYSVFSHDPAAAGFGIAKVRDVFHVAQLRRLARSTDGAAQGDAASKILWPPQQGSREPHQVID